MTTPARGPGPSEPSCRRGSDARQQGMPAGRVAGALQLGPLASPPLMQSATPAERMAPALLGAGALCCFRWSASRIRHGAGREVLAQSALCLGVAAAYRRGPSGMRGCRGGPSCPGLYEKPARSTCGVFSRRAVGTKDHSAVAAGGIGGRLRPARGVMRLAAASRCYGSFVRLFVGGTRTGGPAGCRAPGRRVVLLKPSKCEVET